MMTEDEHGQLKALAWRTLVSVDHVDAKAEDEGLTISQDWRDWRRSVRAVIRGDLMEIPNEPARYVDGFKAHWDKTTAGTLADAAPFVDERDAEIEALRKRVAELETLLSAPPAMVSPAPVVVEDGAPPAEVLAEAFPDEDYTALKQRLLIELGSLRNMLVGNIPMSDEEQAQKLARLAVLEHPKFQTWLQG
jgi:hypothetical protein